jgi:serine/threonine protein kinase
MKLSKKVRYKNTIYTVTHRPIEILEKQEWGFSADVWSLACTIHEIIYGENIFPQQKDENIQASINCILEYCDATKDPRFRKDVVFKKANRRYLETYSGLHYLMKRMLILDPKARPSCKELLDDPLFKNKCVQDYKFCEVLCKELKASDYDIFNSEVHQLERPDRVYDYALTMYKTVQSSPHDLSSREAAKGCISLAHKMLGLCSFTDKTKLQEELEICRANKYVFSL